MKVKYITDLANYHEVGIERYQFTLINNLYLFILFAPIVLLVLIVFKSE